MNAPKVEMLWESTDPEEALRRRFGFVHPQAAAAWLQEYTPTHWGFDVVSCDRIVISAHNMLAWLTLHDRRVIAKSSGIPAWFPRLAALADLTAWLESKGQPVVAPIAARDGRLQSDTASLSLTLLPVVGASLLDAEDREQVAAAGRVLAELHGALAVYPAAHEVQRVLDTARPPEFSPPPGTDDAGPVQLIHNDFRAANILTDGQRIAAVLDFEEVTVGYRITDVAKAAVMLGTKYRNWGPISGSSCAAFLDGYRAATALSDSEERWLDLLMSERSREAGWIM